MTALVQTTAPDFLAKAVMPDGEVHDLRLSDYRGKYVVLFFYPLDFSFVCPTEIVAFSTRIRDFEQRNVQLTGVSVDSQFAHFAWGKMPRSAGGLGDVSYPLIADLSRSISHSFGVLITEGFALRGLFLIDRDGIVRYQVINDLPLGRSVDEMLRMVDALQFFEENGELCPANWHPGDKSIDPAEDNSCEFFASEYKEISASDETNLE